MLNKLAVIMVKLLLSKWLMKRYLLLWKKFKKKEFKFDEALETLKILKDDKRVVGLCLSELHKAGWLEAEFDPQDRRRRLYSLAEYEDVFNTITAEILNEK